MSLLLWLLQILLALWNITGGYFLINNYQLVVSPYVIKLLPSVVWTLYGALEIIFAIGLVLPFRKGRLKQANYISAVVLAVLSLLGIFVYSAYGNFPGLLWGVIPAALLFFIASKRK